MDGTGIRVRVGRRPRGNTAGVLQLGGRLRFLSLRHESCTADPLGDHHGQGGCPAGGESQGHTPLGEVAGAPHKDILLTVLNGSDLNAVLAL